MWPKPQPIHRPQTGLPTLCHPLWHCHHLQTKLMVVSKPAIRSPPPVATVFTSNGLPVEHVDTFKYLGLHFHTSGGISHLIALLKAKAACSWGVVQQRHSQLQCGHAVNLMLSQLQSNLVPALHNGCQIWGCIRPLVRQKQQEHPCSPSMTDS